MHSDSGRRRGIAGTSKALRAGLAAAVVLVAGTVTAGAASLEGSIARGGLLYDKWYKVIGVDEPTETHPLWPAANTKKSGGVTHRCKSCHGWDLKGADGAYASGSYQTGIKGLTGFAGGDPAAVIAILKDDAHGYDGKMSDADFTDLANFVTMGQVDFAQYINYETKAALGDAAKGEPIYQTVCARCHGDDGKKPKEMEDNSVGLLSRGNPWEILHKIMNGHPGSTMPAMRAFGPEVSADILAYAQTLPE